MNSKAGGGHKCINANTTHLYPTSGYPNGIPTNGYHRPKWPVYGEYRWLPPLRYIHSLEHGAIVFMYHPCTPPELVQKFRELATGCLWKHVFFAFKGDLGREWPLAMVTYSHMIKLNDITAGNIGQLKDWIRNHAKIGGSGEGRVFGDGAYNLTLLHKSEIVTVLEDSEICPDGPEKTAPINIGEIIKGPGEIAHDEHGDEEFHEVPNVAPIETKVPPVPEVPIGVSQPPPLQPAEPQVTAAQAVQTVKVTTTTIAPILTETVPKSISMSFEIPVSIDGINVATPVEPVAVAQPTAADVPVTSSSVSSQSVTSTSSPTVQDILDTTPTPTSTTPTSTSTEKQETLFPEFETTT